MAGACGGGGICKGPTVVLFVSPSRATNYLHETWTFNGTSWAQVSVSNPASARLYASKRLSSSMATLGNEVVLFGGSIGSQPSRPLNDTWTFDGTGWAQVPVSNPPPARFDVVMATLGDKVVLFGGTLGWRPLNDTWAFDGASWTQVPVSNPPAARTHAAMATLGNEVVLFGGFRGFTKFENPYTTKAVPLNDTWTFDGTSWTQLSVSNSPPARAGALMATLGNEIVLFGGFVAFGGYAAGNFLNDTWAFDGTSWTQVSISNPPPARRLAATAALP
jgi:N-acetylneuraminic acid mutarotase